MVVVKPLRGWRIAKVSRASKTASLNPADLELTPYQRLMAADELIRFAFKIRGMSERVDFSVARLDRRRR
jgi:hypothetical protein